MSEATAKATRRQLRRVVGETAGAALVEQSQLVARHDRLLSQHSSAIHASDTSLGALMTQVARIYSDVTRFQSMTFRERLVWVITGRLPWA